MTSFTKKKENLFDFSIKSGLYSITCLSNQKHYIGESNHITARLTAHKNKRRRNSHENFSLQKDFNFYGEKNFVFQKLFLGAGLSKEKRENLEILILLTLPIHARYNIYVNWRKRDGIFNPFFGKTHSHEARLAQSTAKQGRPSNFRGCMHTNQVKKWISQSNAGKKDRRKPLFINSNYYESVSEASEKTGLNRRLIRERCHSKEVRFSNYKWAQTKDLKVLGNLEP